ncbi:MAG: glycosyltransferase [Anaerolineae bacterium]|nr:MAG: glycosyltransferase [Anaerolineae bacterium]
MTLVLDHYPLIVLAFLTLSLWTAITNARYLRRFGDHTPSRHFPYVSVLVPARNEAENIEACVRSLLAQDYPNFEVLVLNDHSTDETGDILTRLARLDPRLRVFDGEALPLGWLGKHWACHQLAQRARGDLLLFTDADTRHHPSMLRESVSALLSEDVDLLTAFPLEEVVTWGEKLILPFMALGILAFLPLRLARRLRRPGLSVTIGQFMLFRRSAFEAVGGYASVRAKVVDDVALGRRIIANGFRWYLVDGTERVRCRMYRGFWDAIEGFTKNVFAFFEYRVVFYLLAWAWVILAFLQPPLALLSRLLGEPLTQFPFDLAVVAVAETITLFRVAYKRFGFPAYLAFFYPLTVLLFALIALRSLAFTVLGTATWKGRSLARPALRW